MDWSFANASTLVPVNAGFRADRRRLSAIRAAAIVVNFLSCLILLTLCRRRVLHFSPFFNWLLLSLTVADACLAAVLLERGLVIDVYRLDADPCNTSVHCQVSAFAAVVATTAAYVWTIAIGVCCALTLLNRLPETEGVARRQMLLCSLNWGGPLLIAVAALIRKALGKMNTEIMGPQCWIRTCDTDMGWFEQFIWMLVTAKLWETFGYLTIANVIFIGLSLRRPQRRVQAFPWAVTESSDLLTITHGTLGRSLQGNVRSDSDSDCAQSQQREEDLENIQNKKLFLWIPVCFFLCYIWGTIRFIFCICAMWKPSEADTLHKINRVLEYFESFGGVSQATCNLLLVFLIRPEAREWVKDSVRQLFAKCFAT